MVPIPENIKQFESNLQLSQYRNNIQLYKADPLSFIAHPVFDSFREDRKLVGVIAASIYWKMIFSQILPSSDSHTGIFCVLENDYNQTLTYRVDGNEATFLGPGDLHDSKYDYLEYSEDVNEKLQELATIDRQSYRAVSVSTDFGRYRLRVYPTSETVAEYTTNEPIIYSVLIVCAFLFTSTVFLIYSILVERRQKLVMDTAMNNATRAIETERELNEFLSHEIRNPVSAVSVMSKVFRRLDDVAFFFLTNSLYFNHFL
jgi:signal transduction histidine kinase